MYNILTYLFSPFAATSFNYGKYTMAYAIALILIGIGIKALIVIKKNNKALRRTFKVAPGEFIWLGVILAMLVGARETGVAYLSMRFLMFLVIGISIYYIYKNIHRYIKKYPEIQRLSKGRSTNKNEKTYSTNKK